MSSGRETSSRKGVGYPLIIATMILIGTLLVVKSSFSSGTYSIQISDVVADRAHYEERDLKLVGKIKEDSVRTSESGGVAQTLFTIHDGKGNELDVVYPHNPPDPFKEGRDCIVEGRLLNDGGLLCAKLTVKCPSKYQSESGDGVGVSPGLTLPEGASPSQ